ncbi:MAG: RDD family protein [Sedimentisphaerales bacterium]|nr:RDD family protein [Sedimentisphaerales bacterium]
MSGSTNGGKENGPMRTAVRFADRDYAGLFRRIIIACVDLATVLLICGAALGAVWYVWFLARPQSEHPPGGTLWLVPLTTYLYLTLVKRSRLGSLGLLVTGTRIVDVEGRRPSLLRMTARLFWLLPLPLGLLLDLGWLLEEPARQTLRDKWAGTFVVRRRARPIGRAPLTYHRICLVGIQLIVPELSPTSASVETPAPPTESTTPNRGEM